MGCDIHGFWEVKDHTGNWMAINTINSGRNYEWFGVIAGVRGGPDIGTAHRGVPEDASAAYRNMVDRWGDDLHSHTWLTPPEVQKACQEMNRRSVESYNEEFDAYGYEPIPEPDTKVTQLIVSRTNLGDDVTLNWHGSIKDLMRPNGIIENCVRFVVCFDN
jgi:hypothetical protein